MAPGFARSISLPLSPSHKKASYHVRSVSLPCHSHPLISNLEEQIQTLQSWAEKPEQGSAWIEAGLVHIQLLQITLEDFLQLSQTQETLRQAASMNQLLDDLLQLVDFYSLFLSNVETLKQCNSEVQSAIRRQDRAQIASSLRSQRQVEKHMEQLVSGLRGMTKCKHLTICTEAQQAKMTGIVMEAIHTTALASIVIFSEAGALSAAACSTKMNGSMKSLKTFTTRTFLKKKSSDMEKDLKALEKLDEQEESIRNIEFHSERVYKSLINSRISLLNIGASSL